MNKETKNYDFPFTNALVFASVMQDEDICRDLLERIIPERPIKDLRRHETESTLIQNVDSKFVRLDVLFADDDQWVDIELQNLNEGNLPQRCRYNHSMVTVEAFESGRPYEEIPQSIVIFICRFDYFELGKFRYDFISYDVENSLPFDDGQYTIILNTTADTTDLPDSLRNLFDYINTMNVAEEDPGITKLDEAVQLLNIGEARREIMLWEHEIANKEYRARKEGKAEGLIEGKAEGRAEGELQAKRDIAYKLLQEGLTFDKVSAFNGLSEIELNTILESKQNSL